MAKIFGLTEPLSVLLAFLLAFNASALTSSSETSTQTITPASLNNSGIMSVLLSNPATIPSTESNLPSSTLASLVGGQCIWNVWKEYRCERKGFKCEGGVCVDQRTPTQIEADMQEAADGKDGRCRYDYSTQSYGCTHEGFVCEEATCVDHRTPTQLAADQQASEKKKSEKLRDVTIGLSVTFGVIIAIIVAIGGLICFRRWRRKSLPAQTAVRQERQRQKVTEIELKRLDLEDQERKENAELSLKAENAEVRGGSGVVGVGTVVAGNDGPPDYRARA